MKKVMLVPGEIIRPKDLRALTGLSRSTIYRLSKAGKFVPKIRLTQFACGYRRKDIERWLEERIEKKGEVLTENNLKK